VNFHYSRAASTAQCVAMKNCDVALIQEPWTYKGEIKGLKEVGGELFYYRSKQNPRTCILVKKDFKVQVGLGLCPLHFCASRRSRLEGVMSHVCPTS
jgi:hypothetical protein